MGGKKMAEKEQSSGFGISGAIRAEQQSGGMTDLSSLNDTLVKSPNWKKNTLQRIENVRSGGPDGAVSGMASLEHESRSIREALEHQVEEATGAKRQLRKQSATLLRHSEKIKQLRQTIAKLEAENAGLIATHERELDARRVELLEFQEAYDQFEQQSDRLMDELDQKYERLRGESRHLNPRSML